jgi:hypothetical protein
MSKCSAISSSTNKKCRNPVKGEGLCNMHLRKMKNENENSENYPACEVRVINSENENSDKSDNTDNSANNSFVKKKKINMKQLKKEIIDELSQELRTMKEMYDAQLLFFSKAIDELANKISSIKIKDTYKTRKPYTQAALLKRAQMEHYHSLKNDESINETIRLFYKGVGIENVNKHLVKVYLDESFDKYEESAKTYFIEIAKKYLTRERN